MSLSLQATRIFVLDILQHPHRYDWSYQGLGMLRLHLPEDYRLHIWRPDLAVPNVSTVHTHPWDFTSLIVNGIIRNTRYLPADPNNKAHECSWWNRQTICCGTGGGLTGAPEVVRMVQMPGETYRTGQTYRQMAHEVHLSRPDIGCVTLNRRKYQADRDTAYVYWKVGGWVSAEPRVASAQEIDAFCSMALSQWEVR